MLFAREKTTEDWTLSGTAVLSRPLPAIARDADGYAVPVSTKDTTPAAAPGRGRGDAGGRGGRRALQPGRGGGRRRAA